MYAILKDFRFHALTLTLAALFAGKFSFARLLPFLSDLPHWMLEVRFPLILAALVAAGIAWAQGERPVRTSAYWACVAAYGVFTAFYLYFPFPLHERADYAFGALNVLLFAAIFAPRLLEHAGLAVIAISTALVVTSFAAMPFTDGFVFAGNSATFTRIVSVALFLVLFGRSGALNAALLALHAAALIYSAQLSGLVALGIAVAALPVLALSRKGKLHDPAIKLAVILLAAFVAYNGTHRTIEQKIAFRMKQTEMEKVIEDKKEEGSVTQSSAFPGGLVSREVMRNGTTYNVLTPDFEKDTRVCIDDRSDRFKLYALALAMHSQAPDRWGWGDDAYYMKLTRFSTVNEHRHPHNILLEILVTRGPYFLLAFLALIYGAVLQTLVAACRAPAVTPYAVSMAYILLSAQWSGDLFDFRWFFMLMVPAVAAAFARPTPSNL